MFYHILSLCSHLHHSLLLAIQESPLSGDVLGSAAILWHSQSSSQCCVVGVAPANVLWGGEEEGKERGGRMEGRSGGELTVVVNCETSHFLKYWR